jgi:FkbM family methyltransferase
LSRSTNAQACAEPGYELQEEPGKPLRVLDIGANYGAFAVWARRQWPDSFIVCVEPNPDTMRTLRENARISFGMGGRINLQQGAVTDSGLTHGKLWMGRNNVGECSLMRGQEQADTFIEVDCIDASQLPFADVLKVDTEGMEYPILRDCPLLRDVSVVMLEWHSTQDRWRIGALLCETHECVKDVLTMPNRGIMVWVKSV